MRRAPSGSRRAAAVATCLTCRSSSRSSRRWRALLDDADDERALPEVAPEDDATILFTSGSTGEAKGALSTHRAVTTGVYAYATGLIVLLGILTEDGRAPPSPPRTLLSVPLFHVTGEVPVMLNSFVIGRCMVMMPKWDAAEALRLIEKEKITYFVGVPTMSLELMNHPDRDKYDLSSLTDITAGGAPRPVSHVERLQAGIPQRPARARLRPDRDQRRRLRQFLEQLCGQAGLDRPRAEAAGRARDPRRRRRASAAGERRRDRASAPPRTSNAIGAIRTRPRRCSRADGYVRTGDIGYLDEDGYLFIVDRKKEIIIRGGENISAAEVEAEMLRLSRRRRGVRCSERPTSGLAKCRSRSSTCRTASGSTEGELRAFLDGTARQVQDSRRASSSRPSLCRGSAPARSTAAR